jgi:hypothetical protein
MEIKIFGEGVYSSTCWLDHEIVEFTIVIYPTYPILPARNPPCTVSAIPRVPGTYAVTYRNSGRPAPIASLTVVVKPAFSSQVTGVPTVDRLGLALLLAGFVLVAARHLKHRESGKHRRR